MVIGQVDKLVLAVLLLWWCDGGDLPGRCKVKCGTGRG